MINPEYRAKYKDRQYHMRERILEYKGNKCARCGLEVDNENIRFFEMHHLVHPHGKYTLFNGTNSWEALKKEADKCLLLCMTCHHIIHTEYNRNKSKS